MNNKEMNTTQKPYVLYTASQFKDMYPDGWGYTGQETYFFVPRNDECPYIGVKYANGEIWVYGARVDRKVTMSDLESYMRSI